MSLVDVISRQAVCDCIVVVVCRCAPPDRAWLVFGEDPTSPPLRWLPPPDIDREMGERLEGDLAACFEASWTRRDGALVLSLAARLPLPGD